MIWSNSLKDRKEKTQNSHWLHSKDRQIYLQVQSSCFFQPQLTVRNISLKSSTQIQKITHIHMKKYICIYTGTHTHIYLGSGAKDQSSTHPNHVIFNYFVVSGGCNILDFFHEVHMNSGFSLKNMLQKPILLKMWSIGKSVS